MADISVDGRILKSNLEIGNSDVEWIQLVLDMGQWRSVNMTLDKRGTNSLFVNQAKQLSINKDSFLRLVNTSPILK